MVQVAVDLRALEDLKQLSILQKTLVQHCFKGLVSWEGAKTQKTGNREIAINISLTIIIKILKKAKAFHQLLKVKLLQEKGKRK